MKYGERMWFHYDFMLRCGVSRGMRTFVLLTRIAVHTSACRKSCESHTFFQSISSGLCTPFFSAVGCLGKENSYEGTVESVSVMELDEVIRDRSKHTLSKRCLFF